jgi:drug/metabolite transporter (DMT)-like permease
METQEPIDSDLARSRLLASLAVLAGALCLSVSAILVKLAGVDAATTAMLRCAIAVLVLVPLALGERARRGRLSGRGVGWAVAAGVALGVDYAAWTAAIYQVGAGISTVLINVQVIVLPLLALAVDRERIAVRFVWALPLILVGISLVGGLWDTTGPGGQAVTGTLLGLLAGLGYGIYLFLTRRATKREPGRMIQPLAWATASATVTTTVIGLFSGGLHLTDISARSWVLLVVLAVLGQVVAWLLIHHGSIRLEPATTAALLLIQPVLALGLSAITLAEYPTLLQLLGAAIVVGAVALSNGLLSRRRNVRDHGSRSARRDRARPGTEHS